MLIANLAEMSSIELKHLHFLDSVKDKRERDLYLKKLREDINIRLVEDPDSYMVGRVRNSSRP